MMRILKYTAALAAVAFFAACSADPADPTEETPHPQDSDLPICWNVKDVAASVNSTRVMIGEPTGTGGTGGTGGTTTRPVYPADPEFYITLPEVCATDLVSDPYKENGFAIGLFGDYYYLLENRDTVKVYDLYRGARLVYLPEASADLPSKWDTNVAMRYWHPGAKYIFRAYYPQRLHGYTISTSNATTLAMTYPSRKLQYDLLLGAVEVDTNDKDWRGSNAVDLQLKHALAALRFEFRLGFKDADFLTSVYLINDEKCHFFSQGTVTYSGAGETERTEWLEDYNPPATEVLYKWVPPLKYWYGKGEDKDGDGVIEVDEAEELSADDMLKEWGWVNGEAENVPLVPFDEEGNYYEKYNPVLMYANQDMSLLTGDSNTSGGEDTPPPMWTGKIAHAYYGMEQYYDLSATHQWKNCNADEVAADGTLYCRNSGWLLIPPQQSYGKLTLCFTTKRGGEAVYKVALPQKTGTLIDKDGKLMKDKDGHLIKETQDGTGTDAWVAGMRYTYRVTLSQTDLSVDLSIEPWNERKHSTEIIF